MKPIRGEQTRKVAHDPWARTETQLAEEEVTHVVSDSGAIESHRTERQFANACGCLNPTGGFCAECSEPVCRECFGFCQHCSMPLCPRHSKRREKPSASNDRYCAVCYDAERRKRMFSKAFRFLLSPVVRFDDPDEK